MYRDWETEVYRDWENLEERRKVKKEINVEITQGSQTSL